MLPRTLKLNSPQQFTRVIRGGSRAGTRTLVVHLRPASKAGYTEPKIAQPRGPRFGFVVSKAVGNAVVRHAVTRKLRQQCLHLARAGVVGEGEELVVRALPAIASVDSRAIYGDLCRAVAKARRREK